MQNNFCTQLALEKHKSDVVSVLINNKLTSHTIFRLMLTYFSEYVSLRHTFLVHLPQ